MRSRHIAILVGLSASGVVGCGGSATGTGHPDAGGSGGAVGGSAAGGAAAHGPGVLAGRSGTAGAPAGSGGGSEASGGVGPAGTGAGGAAGPPAWPVTATRRGPPAWPASAAQRDPPASAAQRDSAGLGGAAAGSGGLAGAAAGGPGTGGAAGSPPPKVNVLTHHYDNRRTGANLQEVVLTTANVNVNEFGKLFEWQVDGDVFAQPLYVSGVSIPGNGTHDVVYVASMHNTLFAFDASSPSPMPLWATDLTVLGSPIPVSETEGLDVQPGPQDIPTEIGVLSTPVIDPATHTIYLVARSLDSANVHHQKLHALDLSTGGEKFGGPVEITASVPGTGSGSVDGQLTFSATFQNQRSALLLANGRIYVCWGSHDDLNDYHGWVMAFDAATLTRTAAWNTTPNGSGAGIWQGGAGPAADSAGNIYFLTGNGDFDGDNQNYGDSFVKLTGDLAVASVFAPQNQLYLSVTDLDLGSAGPILIPGTSYVAGGGKEGKVYLLDTANLGGYSPAGDTVVDEFQVSPLPDCDPHCGTWQFGEYYHIHGPPVFWNGPAGPTYYVWAERDYLKAFRLLQNSFEHTPSAQSPMPAPDGMPGGILSLSANGSQAGTGIIWALHPVSVDGSPTDAAASGQRVHGVLEAFDATDVSRELYDTRMNPERDDVGNFAKFNAPMVANGKVYVATMSKKIAVYGLLGP